MPPPPTPEDPASAETVDNLHSLSEALDDLTFHELEEEVAETITQQTTGQQSEPFSYLDTPIDSSVLHGDIHESPQHIDQLIPEQHARGQRLDYRSFTYIKEVDENLICPVCKTVFIDPITTHCDHVFCRECFELAYQLAPLCPVDRTRLRSSHHYRDTTRTIINMLDNLEVKCPNWSEGCEVVLARSMAQDHVDKYCDYTLVTCPESTCDKMVARKHVDRGCLHWLATCPDCSESVLEIDMAAHRTRSCRNGKTNCGECGAEIIKMDEELHKESCPEAAASCPWKQYGCEHTSKRKELVLHQPNCALKVMGPIMDSLRTEVHTLTTREKDHTKEIASLKSELERFKALGSPAYDSDFASMSSNIAGAPATTDSDPYDSRDQYLLSQLASQETKVDQLALGLSNMEAQHAGMLYSEVIPLKEQMAELRSNLGAIGCHVRWLMNLRLQERRPGMMASSVAAAGSMGSNAGPSSSSGEGNRLLPRRLSDTGGNITKL